MLICLVLVAKAVILVAAVENSPAVEGDFCNNGCLNRTDNWCNLRRTASDGTVLRCVEKARYGQNCVSDCKKGSEDHYWCWYAWHYYKSWEYCGLEGQTRYGARCIGECAQKGEDYWWCYTEYDRYDSSKGTKWEYCSPPGQVKKVTYTTQGQECTGDCGTQGKSYWWCYKSMRWRGNGGRGGRSSDDSWDYCSPQSIPYKGKGRTRYDKPCKDACASRGEKYFWCNTWDDNWDYCSPRVEEGQRVIAKGGRRCAGICDKREDSEKWCTVISVDEASKDGYWHEAYNKPCGEGRRWEKEDEEESGMSGWLIALIVILCLLAAGFCIKKFFC